MTSEVLKKIISGRWINNIQVRILNGLLHTEKGSFEENIKHGSAVEDEASEVVRIELFSNLWAIIKV